MNVLLILFNKTNGAIMGEKRVSLPLFCLPTNTSGVFYIEPDETLTTVCKDFVKYDCLVEVL